MIFYGKVIGEGLLNSVTCFFYVSEVFDTADHNLPLSRLEADVGVSGVVVSWLLLNRFGHLHSVVCAGRQRRSEGNRRPGANLLEAPPF